MKRKTFIEIIAHIQAQQRRDSEFNPEKTCEVIGNIHEKL